MTSYIGAGLLAVDHIYLSTEDKKRPREYEYLGSSGGGTVSNILCMLGLLEHNSSIFGLTGNDLGERIIKQDLRDFNIDDSFLITRGDRHKIKTTRQFSHRILQSGKHDFISKCLSCDMKFTRDYQVTKNDIPKRLLNEIEVNHFIFDRANEAIMDLANRAKKNGNAVIFDFGFNIYGKNNENNEKILKLCDIVKTNDANLKRFLNERENLSDIFMNKYSNVDALFVTNEEKGVYGYMKIMGDYEEFNLPAIQNLYIKDASGSGDIFLAVMLNEIIDNGQITSNNLYDKINRAQALASLNCSLYGARSLQRYFLNNGFTKNEIIDLCDDILKRGEITELLDPYLGLPRDVSKPYRLSQLDSCQICGNLTHVRKEQIIIKSLKKKKRNLHKSLIQVPWTMMSSYLIGKNNRNDIEYLNKNGAIFIGSGGSYSASIFAENLLLRIYNQIIKPMNPFELESFDFLNPDIPIWFISHGGNNADILGSALWAVEYLHCKNGVIIIGDINSKLADLARDNNWEIIHIPSKERNFVSVVGYLSQVAVLSGLLTPDNNLQELDDFFSEKNILSIFKKADHQMYGLANEIAPNEKIIESLHLVGLARGWGWPALIDLESKLVEGGICTIEVAELKNYTHGRYINTFGAYDRKNRTVLMFCTPKDAEFVSYLGKKFGRYIKNKIIKTENDGIVGSLELIIQSIFLAWHLGQIAQKNILKPKFPREARGLYSWEPPWRKGKWKDL